MVSLIETKKLAEDKINKFLPNKGWTFKFSKGKHQIGCCRYKTKTISISQHYILAKNIDMNDIEETILHEIGHAIAGPGAGHGFKWIMACHSIGLHNPSRLVKKPIQFNTLSNYLLINKRRIYTDVKAPEIVGTYDNPRKTTFNKMKRAFVKGRKSETLGYLELVSTEDYKQLYDVGNDFVLNYHENSKNTMMIQSKNVQHFFVPKSPHYITNLTVNMEV